MSLFFSGFYLMWRVARDKSVVLTWELPALFSEQKRGRGGLAERELSERYPKYFRNDNISIYRRSCMTLSRGMRNLRVCLYFRRPKQVGPMVHTKTYIFAYSTHNIWSYFRWSPVIFPYRGIRAWSPRRS